MRSKITQYRRAMTIVEVLMALIVVSLISVGVAAMLHAAEYGTSSQREVRRVAVRSQQVRLRLEDAIRQARQILAAGETSAGHGYLVLWRGDTNTEDTNQNKINLSELELIELPDGSSTLTSYVATTLATDTVYESDSNFYKVAQNAKDDGDLTGTTWAESMDEFGITLDEAAAADARLVTWRFTLTDQELSETLVSSIALRVYEPAS